MKCVPLQTHGEDVEPAWGGGRLPGGSGLSLEGGGDREKESSGLWRQESPRAGRGTAPGLGRFPAMSGDLRWGSGRGLGQEDGLE